MSKKNIKIVYDKKSQVLSVVIGKSKGVDSDLQGNAVLDYDKNGKIVKIDLYDFDFESFKDSRRALADFSRRGKSSIVVR